MVEVTYELNVHNGTATFKYGNFVESFDTRDKGMMEVYEHIKYAAIAAGLTLSDDTLENLLREVKGLNNETPISPAQILPCKCELCGKRFHRPQGLGRHKLSAHGIKGTSRKPPKKVEHPPQRDIKKLIDVRGNRKRNEEFEKKLIELVLPNGVPASEITLNFAKDLDAFRNMAHRLHRIGRRIG